MTKPILTPTEYHALCNVLEWAWMSVYQEPELCLKDINYSAYNQQHDIDPIKTGECGLGLAEAFEYTLNDRDKPNILIMIETLMYKLNCNHILANGHGNSWETLAPLVDNNECDRLEETNDDPNITTQTLEGYVVESIGLKNKTARLQEHFDNVNEAGWIQIGDDLWIDGDNSDIFPTS